MNMNNTPSTPPCVYDGSDETKDSKPGMRNYSCQLFTPITTTSNKVVELSQRDVDNVAIDNVDDTGVAEKLSIPEANNCFFKEAEDESIDQKTVEDENYSMARIRHSKGNNFLAKLTQASLEQSSEQQNNQDDEKIDTKEILMTPINKVKVREDPDSDTSCDEEFIKREEIRNPFLSDGEEKPHNGLKPASRKRSEVDYSKELELVNHKTGERIVKKLSSSQARIKPRRLTYDQSMEDEKLLRGIQDYNNKYMMKNSGKLHKLSSARSLYFDIYDDNKDQ